MKTQKTNMTTRLGLILAGAVCLASVAEADTTLVYELTDAQGNKIEQRYQIHGRFLRIDSDADSQPNSLILDAGYMFMYVVDPGKQTFTTFGSSPFHQGKQMPAKAKTTGTAEPETADTKKVSATSPQPPVLSPTGQKQTVAGVRCMVVNEIRNDKPVAEHCLANAAALGMTSRELITMARLIEFSKQWTDPDWIAVQSDEDFVSIQSVPPAGNATFVLKSVSHEILPADHFRVPSEYQKLEPENDYAGLITGKK
jgi:hypothetical protein